VYRTYTEAQANSTLVPQPEGGGHEQATASNILRIMAWPFTLDICAAMLCSSRIVLVLLRACSASTTTTCWGGGRGGGCEVQVSKVEG